MTPFDAAAGIGILRVCRGGRLAGERDAGLDKAGHRSYWSFRKTFFSATAASRGLVETIIKGGIVQVVPQISSRHYFAIFILAAPTLSYQILITRFFSVMLYYHFAFAAISLAMLGLTRGAMKVYGQPDRYGPERVSMEFAQHASWFAMSGVGAMIAFLCVPLVIPGDYVAVSLAIA